MDGDALAVNARPPQACPACREVRRVGRPREGSPAMSWPTVPAVLALARRARWFVVANLVIAAAFIAVLATWDLLGALSLPLGVAGHEGSTVIVDLNGLRLLRAAAWRRALSSCAVRDSG
jgi:hypothetical protein